jgi:hypothetical protein
MTPERAAELVARWVRFDTRKTPPECRERRIGGIDADLHDHIAHDRARGIEERRIARSIVVRMVCGMAADASWRRTIARSSTRKDTMKNRTAVAVALVTAFVPLVPLVAMQFIDEVAWGVADFVFAGILLGGTGMLLARAVTRPASLAYRIAAVVVGLAAIVLGEADDAPGLVLFGLLAILGAVALTARTALRGEWSRYGLIADRPPVAARGGRRCGTEMARPPAWICPECDQRDDPRFHECADRVLVDEPPASGTADAAPAGRRPDSPRRRRTSTAPA